MGSIDIAMTGNPFYTGTEASLNVLDLPYLFRDFDHVYKVSGRSDRSGDRGEDGEARAEGAGLHGDRLPQPDQQQAPGQGPGRFQGQSRFGVTPNPAHVQAFQLLDAVPTPMPFGEVYMALKTGAVDGQENPITPDLRSEVLRGPEVPVPDLPRLLHLSRDHEPQEV